MDKPERNPDLEKLVAAAVNDSPFYKHVSMRVREFTDTGSVMEMEVGDEHKNLWGTMHGGALSALADSSCGTAITQIMSGEEKVVTLDLRVQFLKPVTKGTLVSYGKVVHKSGRHVISECEVFDEEQAL
ncbi:MAG: PaaI family thioesterase, partial [bacterium]